MNWELEYKVETLSRYEQLNLFQIGSGMWWISILTAVVVVFLRCLKNL